MTGLLHDFRSAARSFCHDWRFSATLVVTLATGIAATAIVFNVLNNTLLRPLPIPDESRVYRLLDWTRGPDGEPLRRSTRVHNFLAIRDNTRSFESVVALRALNFALDRGEMPVQVYIGLVSPRSFELLGIKPLLGRLFTAAEEDAGTLMASALMADNLSRLTAADLGLRAAELATIEMTLPESRYEAAADRIAVARALIDAARSVAGVQEAAIITVNPLDRGSIGAAIETEDQPLPPREPGHIVNNRLVTDGWFETAGVVLRQGRLFTPQDVERAPLVAIVSQRMADRFWPGSDVVGKRVRLARPGMPWLTVVGVVGDVRDFGDWRETWYLPYMQHASTLAASNLHLMLRSPLPPDVLGRAVQHAVHTVDARLPVPIPTPMTAMWTTGLDQQRLAASASVLFGVSGLLLAIIGTYGVLAYAVSARAREFGIRLALGAERRVVLLDVLQRGAMLAGVGLAVGVGAGLLVNRALGSVATEAAGTPAPLVVAVIGALGTSALIASLVPAIRATRVDPADVMRVES